MKNNGTYWLRDSRHISMRSKFSFALAGLFLFAFASWAQNFAIQWHTLAAGGGRSSFGNYSVQATVGQPNVGHAAGGQYGVDGGFWSWLAVIPTAGAPVLTIQCTSSNTVVLSWQSSGTDYTLQASTHLTEQNWSAAPGSQTRNGTTVSVTIPVTPGNHFFRLSKP